MSAWRIRVTGTRRKNVDVNLVAQAIVALSEQLHAAAHPVIPRGRDARSSRALAPEEAP